MTLKLAMDNLVTSNVQPTKSIGNQQLRAGIYDLPKVRGSSAVAAAPTAAQPT
jgi:hypothetical protein